MHCIGGIEDRGTQRVALRSVERESKLIDASVLGLAHMVWAARQGWMTGDQVTAFVNEPKRASEARSRPSNHAKPDAPRSIPGLEIALVGEAGAKLAERESCGGTPSETSRLDPRRVF
jgi:hypothetical protein